MLADSNVFDRDSHLLTDCHGNSAFGGPVEFREDNSRTVGGFAEMLRLIQAILTGRGVNHQQAFVGSAGF